MKFSIATFNGSGFETRNTSGSSHHAHRDRVFLAPRPLEYYTDALERNGLTVTDVSQATIVADVNEWFEFLGAYHDAVLGWVGGTKRIEGEEPTEEAVGGSGTARSHWTTAASVPASQSAYWSDVSPTPSVMRR